MQTSQFSSRICTIRSKKYVSALLIMSAVSSRVINAPGAVPSAIPALLAHSRALLAS